MEAIAITDHAPAIPDGAHPWHFQNLKAIPREIYGVKILYGAEVNILDLEGNIDLADEVLEKLDVVNASIHAPCYKDGDATDHTSAYLAIVNNPLVDVICHSGSPAFVYDYEKIIDLAKKNHKLIEINNHSFDVRKASIPNCRKIAEICKEKEVGIVVSSDAHITFDLGNYNNALGMLSEISFPEKLVINRDLKSFEAYILKYLLLLYECLVSPENALEIEKIIHFCKDTDTPYMLMGNGSNMLVGDGGIRGVVIHIGNGMSKCRIEGEEVYADAGILMSTLSKKILEANLTGFEFAGGIPGTLGGGIYMNAGAYGGELEDIIENVTFICPDGLIKTETADKLDFGYRHSMFENGGYTILSCKLKLKKGNYDEIKALMADYNKRRSDKQPLSQPSAGSTFKRPEGYFAGKLIQDAGLMGYSVGGAMVSDKHAGFVVNKGGATAKDVLDLIKYVQDTVEEKFGVKLEPEVRLIGEQ